MAHLFRKQYVGLTLLTALGAANHDPAVFDEPHRLLDAALLVRRDREAQVLRVEILRVLISTQHRDGADVDAEIDVATVIIKGGTVRGQIRARTSIELYVPSHVIAALHSPSVFIDKGVHFEGKVATTQSLVMRSKSGTVRLISSRHRLDKLRDFASVEQHARSLPDDLHRDFEVIQ